jgi:hypothetical protein
LCALAFCVGPVTLGNRRQLAVLVVCVGKGRHRSGHLLGTGGTGSQASAKFVQTVEKFGSDVTVSRGGETVGGRSIMGLLTPARLTGRAPRYSSSPNRLARRAVIASMQESWSGPRAPDGAGPLHRHHRLDAGRCRSLRRHLREAQAGLAPDRLLRLRA